MIHLHKVSRQVHFMLPYVNWHKYGLFCINVEDVRSINTNSVANCNLRYLLYVGNGKVT